MPLVFSMAPRRQGELRAVVEGDAARGRLREGTSALRLGRGKTGIVVDHNDKLRKAITIPVEVRRLRVRPVACTRLKLELRPQGDSNSHSLTENRF